MSIRRNEVDLKNECKAEFQALWTLLIALSQWSYKFNVTVSFCMLTPQRVLTSDPVFNALITDQESGMGFVLQRHVLVWNLVLIIPIVIDQLSGSKQWSPTLQAPMFSVIVNVSRCFVAGRVWLCANAKFLDNASSKISWVTITTTGVAFNIHLTSDSV